QAQLESGVRGNVPAPFGAGERLQSPTYRYPFLRRGHPLSKALSPEHVRRLFAQITHPLDHALCLLMLRCGLRVSEVARLTRADLDWEQTALRVQQGKGRKDRIVYIAADA